MADEKDIKAWWFDQVSSLAAANMQQQAIVQNLNSTIKARDERIKELETQVAKVTA